MDILEQETLVNKTFEYPFADPIPAQWLTVSNRIWNDALRLLEWRQYWLRLQKCLEAAPPEDWGEWDLTRPIALEMRQHNGNWGMACSLGRDQRIDKTKSWDKANLEFRLCRNIVPTKWLNEPPIDGFSNYSLAKPFTAKRGYDVCGMPSGLVQSLLKTLAESWGMYQKGKRGRPRYRGRKNPIETLAYDGFRHHCKLAPDGTVSLLGMSPRQVHGIAEHLAPLIERTAAHLKENPTDKVLKKAETVGLDAAAEFYAIPGAYALVQRDGKTYLQISGQFYIPTAAATAKPIEITTGTEHLWKAENILVKHCDHSGDQKRLLALQKRLSIAKFGSNNWQAIKNKIAKIQGKIKRRTKRHQQYHAQLLANHQQVTILPYVPTVIPAPVPRPDGTGDYLPNGASAIAEQNQKRAKAATAQFIGFIKDKSTQTGAQVFDQSKAKMLDLESQEIDRQAAPQADVKQPKSSEHGQSRKRQQGGKAKANSLNPTEPRKSGRNRKRERAIG